MSVQSLPYEEGHGGAGRMCFVGEKGGDLVRVGGRLSCTLRRFVFRSKMVRAIDEIGARRGRQQQEETKSGLNVGALCF